MARRPDDQPLQEPHAGIEAKIVRIGRWNVLLRVVAGSRGSSSPILILTRRAGFLRWRAAERTAEEARDRNRTSGQPPSMNQTPRKHGG